MEPFLLAKTWTRKLFHVDNSERQATSFTIDVVKLILVHDNATAFSTKRRLLAHGKKRGQGRATILDLKDGDPGSTGDVAAILPGIWDIVAIEEVGDVAGELAPRSIAERDRCGRCLGFARECLGGAWSLKHGKFMLADTQCLIESRDTRSWHYAQATRKAGLCAWIFTNTSSALARNFACTQRLSWQKCVSTVAKTSQ